MFHRPFVIIMEKTPGDSETQGRQLCGVPHSARSHLNMKIIVNGQIGKQ